MGHWSWFVLGLVWLAASVGCRQNGNQSAFRWPWQVAQSNAAQQAGPQVASAANNAARSAEQAELAQLVDLMRRQNEQTRLSEQQRSQLARLTDLAKRQSERESLALQERQAEQLTKLQDNARQLAQQKQELGDLRRKSLNWTRTTAICTLNWPVRSNRRGCWKTS